VVRDTELFRHLLGLAAPWTVGRVELDVTGQRVDVFAEHTKPKSWPCPECGTPCGLHDHDEERTWRHLDSCQFQTILHARVPRVSCQDHGVRQVRVPWAEPRSRFTALFERLAIDVLLETDIAGAAELLGLSWDEAHHIMERAVARGLARRPHQVPRVLGIDEKSLAKGHRYATIACDLDAGTVIGIAEGKYGKSHRACLGRFSINDLQGVEAVAMDMSEAYLVQMRALLDDPDDKIVLTDSTSSRTSTTPSTRYAAVRTRCCASTATSDWSARSTCGSTAPRTCRSDTTSTSPPCARRT
jgi:transposase